LIAKEKSLLQNLIVQRGGYFYVSGASKNMPKAVKEALAEALDNSADYVTEMIKQGRYQEEVWS
jgi:sulfite reductase alpha subunit-like flavoprotein